jgi:hypothetical protein
VIDEVPEPSSQLDVERGHLHRQIYAASGFIRKKGSQSRYISWQHFVIASLYQSQLAAWKHRRL